MLNLVPGVRRMDLEDVEEMDAVPGAEVAVKVELTVREVRVLGRRLGGGILGDSVGTETSIQWKRSPRNGSS